MEQRMYVDPAELAQDLKEALGASRFNIIVVDGFHGSAKTTLAGQLSVQLQIEHIELDRFLSRNMGGYLEYLRYVELAEHVDLLQARPRSFVIEGVCIRAVLSRLKIETANHVYVKRVCFEYWTDGQIVSEEPTIEAATERESKSTAACATSITFRGQVVETCEFEQLQSIYIGHLPQLQVTS